jgi:hypothetical protein
MKFWEFGGTIITFPSKVPVIWIAHACLREESAKHLNFDRVENICLVTNIENCIYIHYCIAVKKHCL